MAASVKSLSHVDPQEVYCILNQISILGGLSEEELLRIIPLLEKVSYDKDEVIFYEGDEPSYIYIIESGRVKIVADMNNEPLELIEFSTGECFGETSVIGIQPHTASALSLTKTELIVLSRKTLWSLFKNDKELFSRLLLNIAREACRRLHKTDEILLHYVHKH